MEKNEVTELFLKYRKMIEQSVWKTAKRYYQDPEELRGQAFLIFCEATERYNSSKSTFSTFLFYRLRTLADYAGHEYRYNKRVCPINFKEFPKKQETVLEDTKYKLFEEAMERLETALDLSSDAQIVLDFIISRDWEIPGINHLPRRQTTARWMKEENGWTGKRSIHAWEEVRQWYRAGNHVLQEA